MVNIFFAFLFLGFGYSFENCLNFFETKDSIKKESYEFENGHNVPLQKIMNQMKVMEEDIREFVDGLRATPISKHIQLKNYRTQTDLDAVLDVTQKFEKVFIYLIEKSDSIMMTPRIEMIPPEKRAQFIQMYKKSYADYFVLVQKLRLLFESFKNLPPEQWDTTEANDLMMQMDALMGRSHNRF